MRNLLYAGVLSLALSSYADLSIRVEEQTQKYTVMDAGKPVLTYNYGIVPVPEGITGKYAVPRSNYIHPLYGPNGEVLTADYQKDHAHHRGIYWAWPEVTYQGEKRDLHALQGVFTRPVKLRQQATQSLAIIETDHVWKWGDTEEIVQEHAIISVHAMKDHMRIIDFHFRLEGLKPGVTLARRQQSAYGGFNVRLSARKDQQIIKHVGTPCLWPQEAWAELIGVPPEGKEPIGIFMLQNPSNPIYPCDWQDYPNLNWLQPTFPAKEMSFPLTPGKPLELAYRLIIRSGAGLKEKSEALFAAYAPSLPDPLEKQITYTLGLNRLALSDFENGLKKMEPRLHKTIEQRLLALLAKKPSQDFTRWACRQLHLVGSDASIPALTACLTQDAWMEACDTLLALPGQKGLDALLKALPTLKEDRLATAIHAIGLRKEASTVSPLSRYVCDANTQTSVAAMTALSKIEDTASAKILLKAEGKPDTRQHLIASRLALASLLTRNHKKSAQALFESVYTDPQVHGQERGAALIGLTRLNAAEMSKNVLNALADQDPQLRHAAAAALRLLDLQTCEKLQTRFPTMPHVAQLTLLSLWGERAIPSVQPTVLTCLKSTDADLKQAAVKTLGTIGDSSAVPALLTLATTDRSLTKEIESTLQQMSGNGVARTLQEIAQSNEKADATLALKILAARLDPGCIPFLLNIAASKETPKAEMALTTLKNQATAEVLPKLREILEAKPDLRESLTQAIVAICKRQQNPKPYLAEFLNTPIKAAIEQQLKILSMKNLAPGKRISAAHPWQDSLRPELAIDENPETYWSCAHSPTWLQVDLGTATPVSRIKVVNYVDGTRYYQYRVELSLDEKQWTCVGDMSQNIAPATKEGVTHDFKEIRARYVRVTMLKNSANPGMHISELGIFHVTP